VSANDIVLVIVVGTALVFDFTNGFHDTANVVATSISTHAMPPRIAVAYAAIFNFAGAFISLAVAATVAKDVVNGDVITPTVVFPRDWSGRSSGTWSPGPWVLPSSSSHALIGGVVGSAFAAAGADAVLRDGLIGKVLIPAVIAPVVAFVVGVIAINIVYGVVGRERPGPVNRGFRLGQVISGGMLALAHGTNDAQKTMGVITLALIANGSLSENASVPFWVVISAASAISLGTYFGGWRIIRTIGNPHHQDGCRAGLLGTGRGRRGDPGFLALRLSALDDPGDQRRRHGGRGGQARLGGALGCRREHRRRLAPHPPGGGGDRSGHLRIQQPVRRRGGRAYRDRPARDRCADHGVSPPGPAGAAARDGVSTMIANRRRNKGAPRKPSPPSLIAGVGVTAAFSIVIFGVTRSADMARDERPLLATAAGGLAVLAGAVVVGFISSSASSS